MLMTPLRPIWGRAVLAVVLSVCSVVAVAADEAAKPRTPIRKELDTIRDMIQNANRKFRRGLVGIAAPGPTVQMTPAQACCAGNLEYISKSMDKLRKIVRSRSTCFERRGEIQNVEIASIAVRDMRGLSASLQLFVESEDPLEVSGALDSCTRAFLRMSDTLEVLPECESATDNDESGN